MNHAMMLFALCALSQTTAAQTVYQCSVDGKRSYTDQPCPGGRALPAATPAAADGAARLQREQAQLATLQQQRRAREQADAMAQARAARASAGRRDKCARLRLEADWSAEDLARASRKDSAAARLKHQRRAAATALACPA